MDYTADNLSKNKPTNSANVWKIYQWFDSKIDSVRTSKELMSEHNTLYQKTNNTGFYISICIYIYVYGGNPREEQGSRQNLLNAIRRNLQG